MPDDAWEIASELASILANCYLHHVKARRFMIECDPFLAIDHLKYFLSGGPSLYGRVLVPASTRGQCILVWLYMEDASKPHPACRLADGVWRV